MSIKIHHGSHGSFKTAGAIHDDLIPAIKEGRPIVTNVRGMTTERIYEVFPDAPSTLDFHYVDTSTQEGMDKMARFFHWVPHGSFILVDEAQIIFPKKWRQADLDFLAYPGGMEAASRDKRPPTWEHAWDMERHNGFDIVLTTPAISKIREDIRTNAEGAFKHKNLGLYGWLFKGSYMEGFHFADDNGNSASDFQSTLKKRIKKNDPTWKLYDSTQTGGHRDTAAGINILRSPRVYMGLAVIAFALFYGMRTGLPTLHTVDLDKYAPQAVSKPVPVPAVKGSSADIHSVNYQRDAGQVRQNDIELNHPYAGYRFTYLGSLRKKNAATVFLFKLTNDAGSFMLDGVGLLKSGYVLDEKSDCAVKVSFENVSFMATCAIEQVQDQKREPALTQGSAAPAERAGGNASSGEMITSVGYGA